jgi:hypothetical protein
MHHGCLQAQILVCSKSFARHKLDPNYINVLRDEKSNAKRRLTKNSEILRRPGKNGEGRVKTQEDLDAIRSERKERAKQDAAKKVGDGTKRGRPKTTTQTGREQAPQKRGRKGTNAEVEEPDCGNQKADALEPPGNMAYISEMLIDPVLETWKAPVVPRMW